MYKIDVDNLKKRFIISVEGYMKEDEAKQFIDEYESKIKGITPSQYELVLDGKKLKVSQQDLLPILEGLLTSYVKSGFKKIYFITMESAVAMMQMKRVSGNLFDTVTIVDDISEIN